MGQATKRLIKKETYHQKRILYGLYAENSKKYPSIKYLYSNQTYIMRVNHGRLVNYSLSQKKGNQIQNLLNILILIEQKLNTRIENQLSIQENQINKILFFLLMNLQPFVRMKIRQQHKDYSIFWLTIHLKLLFWLRLQCQTNKIFQTPLS